MPFERKAKTQKSLTIIRENEESENIQSLVKSGKEKNTKTDNDIEEIKAENNQILPTPKSVAKRKSKDFKNDGNM